MYDGTVMGVWDAEGGDRDEAIARVILTAAMLREVHVPWEKVVPVLEQMRKAAAHDKVSWAVEE